MVDDRPWEAPDLFGLKPATAFEYGTPNYSKDPGCTREELIARCRRARPFVSLVWTPESDYLQPPLEVSFLRPAVRERVRAAAARSMTFSFILAIVLAFGILAVDSSLLRTLLAFVVVLCTIHMGEVFWRWKRAPELGDAQFDEWVGGDRLAHWVGQRPLTFTRWIVAGLGLVYVVAATQRRWSIDAAALVKAEVAAGYAWRMLTGPLMHVGLWHFLANAGALYAAGRWLETLAHRSYVPLALLFGMVGGSAFSLWFPKTSVGASGGVLAVVALVAGVARRKRTILGPGLFRGMRALVVAIALVGTAGHAFVDNAAHAGGAMAGLLMGAVLFGPRGLDPSLPPPRGIVVSGWIALVILGVAMAATIAEIVAYARGYVILGRYGL